MDKTQAKNKAINAIHALEDSALDAYHTIEDHNALELRHDVKSILGRLADWFKTNAEICKQWYAKQPTSLKIIYGLTVLPVLAVLSLIVFLLVKFGAPILLAVLLGFKLLIATSKVLFFIGYIGYKILKTIVMWYYTISRLYIGGKAKRKRFAAAVQNQFPITPTDKAHLLSLNCKRKELYLTRDDINNKHDKQVKILFSYLRYAVIGQIELCNNCITHWRSLLTLWRKNSRDTIMQALQPVGASLFTPHTLGANINNDRILVPGDAVLTAININADNSLDLSFDIFWVDWHFKFRKSLKPLQISRTHQQTTWQLTTIALRPISWDFSVIMNKQPTP